jgi:hypothetical protein
MKPMPIAAFVSLTVACATSSPTNTVSSPDACATLQSVLAASIAPVDDDVHLRSACVQQYAGADGTVWVDARFFDAAGKQQYPVACRISGYQIRFGKSDEPKPPGETILFVSVSAQTKSQSRFFAQIENADWPNRRPHTYALSPCASTSGTITQVGKRLDIVLEQPKPSDLD